MALNYTKLIQLDLLNDLDDGLLSNKDSNQRLFDFMAVYQEIKNADQFIKDLPLFPLSTEDIERDELVSAIGSTLAIEGVFLRKEEIAETLQEPDRNERIQRNRQEILNSRNVYDYIRQEVDNHKGSFIFTIEHIYEIHKHFTEGINYSGNYPGRFRNCAVTFGDPRKPGFCDNYDSVYLAMKHFIEWLNDKSSSPWSGNIFAKALMAHYYLSEIHPFGDGNGRAARALEAMVLYVNKVNHYCFWSLANFWSANRIEYIYQLGNIRQTCNPYDFILWGAKGYLNEVERIKHHILQKTKQLMFCDYVSYLVNTNNQRPAAKRINKRIESVLKLLARFGRMPLDKFRSDPAIKAIYLKSSAPTANRDLTKMQSISLVRIYKTNGKLFIEPNYEIFAQVAQVSSPSR